MRLRIDGQFYFFKCDTSSKNLVIDKITSMPDKLSDATDKYPIEKSRFQSSGIRNDIIKKNKNNCTYIKRKYLNIKREYCSWMRELRKVDRYSVGDYLRQQILQDFTSADIFGKSQEQIAVDRYHRVKRFLNYRNGILNKMRWFNITFRNRLRVVTKNIDNKTVMFDVSRSYKNFKTFKRKLIINYDEISYRHSTRRKIYGDRLNWHLVYRWKKQNLKKIRDIENSPSTRSLPFTKYLSNLNTSYFNYNEKRSDLLLLLSTNSNSKNMENAHSDKISDSLNPELTDPNERRPVMKPSIYFGEPIIYKLQINDYISNDSNNFESFEIGDKTNMINSSSKNTKAYSALDKCRLSCHYCHTLKPSITSLDPMNKLIMNSVIISSEDDATYCHDYHELCLNQHQNIMAANYFWQVYQLLKERSRQRKQRCPYIFAANIKNYTIDDNSSDDYGNETYLNDRYRRKIRANTHHGIENNGQGEEALASPVVGGPTITYSNHMKNKTIIEERREHVNPSPIAVTSEIIARDITKYFNHSMKENRSEYAVTQSHNIGEETMGSNFSRHHGKGLTGRRTQSSGNLCDPQRKLDDVSKMFVSCSTSEQQRYNISGSLPNNLDNDKQSHSMDNLVDNNNITSDTMDGYFEGTITHIKSYDQVRFHDKSTIGTELVKYHSHDSLKGDPWKQQQNSEIDPLRCQHDNYKSPVNLQIAAYQDMFALRNKNNYYRGETEMSAVGQGSKTLPIRRIDPKWCDPISIRAIHQKNSIDTVDGHQSDCQLVIHRQREQIANVNSMQLGAGEHHNQDQGYASERSPEDEHPPKLSGQSVLNVNQEGNTFRIILQKSSRGLGLSVSGGGTIGPVRVKRLFPQQPAALSNQLKPGDVLLAANGIPLSGLTNYEALEVLRTTSSTVELLVYRQPGETSITPPGDPPTPPARRKLPSPTSRVLNLIPPLHIEPCGEFDIEMMKVGGSLGFTLRKVDSSALGHYIRALVREPALSDGRIQPGDKIVAVDDVLLSPMSHEEAVSLLRQCGPKVKLRLYRDLAQTPVSALSPTEPDHPLRPTHTSLRQEAVDMLCDLAVRRLSPTTSSGSGCQYYSSAPATSPRRLRKPVSRTSTAINNTKDDSVQFVTEVKVNKADLDPCFTETNASNSQMDIQPPPSDSCDAVKPSRPKFLDLSLSSDKMEFPPSLTSNFEHQEHEVPSIETTIVATLNIDDQKHHYDYQRHDIDLLVKNINGNNLLSKRVSMPPPISSLNANNDGVLSYRNPVYQSAKQATNRYESEEHINCTWAQSTSYSSDHDIPAKILTGTEDTIGMKGLLKWKGVMFAPDVNSNGKTQFLPLSNKRCDEKIATNPQVPSHDCEVFMVELTRGWNSRLGFSLQSRDNATIISVVHPDSVAAKNGRLQQGDILIMVNDENVENAPTSDIIDLLRRVRGSIGITVARRKNKSLNT